MLGRVPAMRGWALRRWCDRLHELDFVLDHEAKSVGALFEGSSARLALEHAADLLERCTDVLPRLHDVLRAATLAPVAQLALVHALLASCAAATRPLRDQLLEAVLEDSCDVTTQQHSELAELGAV